MTKKIGFIGIGSSAKELLEKVLKSDNKIEKIELNTELDKMIEEVKFQGIDTIYCIPEDEEKPIIFKHDSYNIDVQHSPNSIIPSLVISQREDIVPIEETKESYFNTRLEDYFKACADARKSQIMERNPSLGL